MSSSLVRRNKAFFLPHNFFPNLARRCSLVKMDAEREALFAFYRATGGDSWARNDGWCTEASLDEWFGVETNDEGSVVKLILRGNNLVGKTFCGPD